MAEKYILSLTILIVLVVCCCGTPVPAPHHDHYDNHHNHRGPPIVAPYIRPQQTVYVPVQVAPVVAVRPVPVIAPIQYGYG